MMLTTVQDSVLQLLPSRRKTGQNGWTSFNAPCCQHNGESADTRSRGGIKTDAGKVSYHCFNCQYTASYQPGRHLSYKFRKLLAWLGADDNTVRRLVIEAVRVKDLIAPEELAEEPEQEIKYETRSLPAEAREISDIATFYSLNDYQGVAPEYFAAVEYLVTRRISTEKYKFYWTPETANNLYRRIIVPFYYKQQIVGYTSRALVDAIKPKYYSNHPADFVFNIDTQPANAKFVIVCEGPFDAMSIDGVAVSGAEVSDTQAEVIDRLQREIIYVPDNDRQGRRAVDRAIDLGWTVSFPIWQETCKDINEAVIKYGKLFVLKSILDARETSRLKIELRARKLYN